MKNSESLYRESRVIKVGTNSLVEGFNLNEDVQYQIAKSMVIQRMNGIWTVVTTSGAVTLGGNEFNGHETLDREASVRLFSTVGQKKLMRSWEDAFRRAAKDMGIDRRIHTSEGILTRNNFDEDSVSNLRSVVREAMHIEEQKNDLIFFVENGNDLIAKEHISNDNDGLASDIARAIRAKVLYLLTNEDGLYTGNPQSPESLLVRDVYVDTTKPVEQAPEYAYIADVQSTNGTGGMRTKLDAIHRYLSDVEDGIAHVGNGTVENIIWMLDEKRTGTRFHT